MKIISQTSDTMILKESVLMRTVSGVLFIIVGGTAMLLLLNIPGLISGGTIAIIGLWLILYANKIEITISKQLNQILCKRKRVIGTKTVTYVLTDVVSVDLRRGQARATGFQYYQNKMLTEQSLIVFKDGTELILEDKKTSGHLADSLNIVSGRDRKTTTAKSVALFMGIPFKETKPTGVINLSKVPFLPHWLGGPGRS